MTPERIEEIKRMSDTAEWYDGRWEDAIGEFLEQIRGVPMEVTLEQFGDDLQGITLSIARVELLRPLVHRIWKILDRAKERADEQQDD